MNPYVYADDNPVNLVDPSGRDPLICYADILGLIATAGLFATAVIALIAAAPETAGLSLLVLYLGALFGGMLLVSLFLLFYHNAQQECSANTQSS